MAERPDDVDDAFEEDDTFADDGEEVLDEDLDDDLDEEDLDGDLDGDLEVVVEDDEIVEVDLDTAAAAEEVEDEESDDPVASAVTGVFDDEPVVGADGDGEDLSDALEGIRDGEFVCRRCHLARRDTQLADEKAMLCRDCA